MMVGRGFCRDRGSLRALCGGDRQCEMQGGIAGIEYRERDRA